MTLSPRFVGLTVVGLLATMVACVAPFSPEPAAPVAEAIPMTTAEPLPQGDPKDVQTAAEGVTAFAADLFAQVRTEKGNLIVSPYSIYSALAMTAAGTRGDTYDQMQKVLRLPATDKLPPTFGSLATSITAQPKNARSKPELTTANSIWAQQGYPWKKEYLGLVSAGFRAGVFDVDFRADPQAARNRINAWVEKETKDRIKDLVPPDAVTTATKMILTNAVYFKARWEHVFNQGNTQPGDFSLANGTKTKAPLMYQWGRFALLETDRMQVLRLPYDGRASSMYVILPKKVDGLPVIEKELNAANLAKWTQGDLGTEDVKVWLPKFKYTVPTELAPILKEMGIKDAFDSHKANFKGMTDNPEGLFISRVIHKAFVEVDEVGTEAAAATAVVLAPGAVPRKPAEPKTFKADHPFLFVIKHEPTGAVLFVGRVEDPTK